MEYPFQKASIKKLAAKHLPQRMAAVPLHTLFLLINGVEEEEGASPSFLRPKGKKDFCFANSASQKLGRSNCANQCRLSKQGYFNS